MNRKTILLAFLFIATLLGNNMAAENNKKQAGNMKPFPTEAHELKTKEDLEKYVGERVKTKGTMAKTVLHPDLKYPDLSSMGGYVNQYNIDTTLGQVGLISQKTIGCKKDIEVEGILRFTLLEEKNIEKTSNVAYIQVLSFKCE